MGRLGNPVSVYAMDDLKIEKRKIVSTEEKTRNDLKTANLRFQKVYPGVYQEKAWKFKIFLRHCIMRCLFLLSKKIYAVNVFLNLGAALFLLACS